jgi:hypothetical protein
VTVFVGGRRLSSVGSTPLRSVAAICLVLAIAALTVTAPGLPFIALWLTCGVVAVALGLVVGSAGTESLVLAILPATVLTDSALVPFEGRYLPAAAAMIALLIAARSTLPAGIAQLRARPALAVVLIAYGAWAVVTTASSTDRGVSATYVVGLALSLTVCAVVLPSWVTAARVERFITAIAVIGVAIVASGWLLLLLRGVVIFGKDVGVYFVEELALLGQATGITFYQNYGPFVGPSTEPLAFAAAASLYLASRTTGLQRAAAYAAAAIVITGLVVTFSREGLLMAAIAVAALVAYDLWHRQLSVVAGAAAAFLAIVALASLIGAVGVLGRLDLTAQWYGSTAVAILMNPVHTERGDVTTPSPTPGQGGTPVPTPAPVYPAVVDLKTASSLDARFSLWAAALAATAKSPVVGYGLGTDAEAIVPYLNGEDARLQGVTTHSTFMRMLVEMGVPGLLIQVWLSVLAAALALRAVFRRSSRAVAVLAGCLAAILFHELFGTLIFGGFGYTNFLFAALTSVLALSDLGAAGDGLRPAPQPTIGDPQALVPVGG